MQKFIFFLMCLGVNISISFAQSINPPYEINFNSFETFSDFEEAGWIFDGSFRPFIFERESDSNDKYLLLQTATNSSTETGVYDMNTISSTLKVNLQDNQLYILNFDYKCFTETPEYCKDLDIEQLNPSEDDGIYLCTENTCLRVHHFSEIPNSWQPLSLDINLLAEVHGINVQDVIGIKFQYVSVLGEIWQLNGLFVCQLEKTFFLDNISISQTAAAGAATRFVEYAYDASGNRIGRIVGTVVTPSTKSARIHEEDLPQNNLGESSIVLAPNPTKGQVKVIVNGEDEEVKFIYQVYTSSGKKVLANQFVGNGEHPIDLSGFAPGMYILHLKKGKQSLTYKIIKQ